MTVNVLSRAAYVLMRVLTGVGLLLIVYNMIRYYVADSQAAAFDAIHAAEAIFWITMLLVVFAVLLRKLCHHEGDTNDQHSPQG